MTETVESLGDRLPLWSLLPFALFLVAIALLEVLAATWWGRLRNKALVAGGLAGAAVVWLGVEADGRLALAHSLTDYVSFIILLSALFVISGGIEVRGSLTGTPLANIPIVSMGGQKQFIDYIRAGKTYGTTPFAPKSEAAEALDLAVACLNGDKTPVFFSEKDLPPVKALKDHNYMIDPTDLDLYQPQW